MTKFWISGENPAENEEFFIVKNFYNKNPKTAEERKLEKKSGEKTQKKHANFAKIEKRKKKTRLHSPPTAFQQIVRHRSARRASKGRVREGDGWPAGARPAGWAGPKDRPGTAAAAGTGGILTGMNTAPGRWGGRPARAGPPSTGGWACSDTSVGRRPAWKCPPPCPAGQRRESDALWGVMEVVLRSFSPGCGNSLGRAGGRLSSERVQAYVKSSLFLLLFCTALNTANEG